MSPVSVLKPPQTRDYLTKLAAMRSFTCIRKSRFAPPLLHSHSLNKFHVYEDFIPKRSPFEKLRDRNLMIEELLDRPHCKNDDSTNSLSGFEVFGSHFRLIERFLGMLQFITLSFDMD